jgi:hypothetical protein
MSNILVIKEWALSDKLSPVIKLNVVNMDIDNTGTQTYNTELERDTTWNRQPPSTANLEATNGRDREGDIISQGQGKPNTSDL